MQVGKQKKKKIVFASFPWSIHSLPEDILVVLITW
jgi:hypothetical protein